MKGSKYEMAIPTRLFKALGQYLEELSSKSVTRDTLKVATLNIKVCLPLHGQDSLGMQEKKKKKDSVIMYFL